MTRVVHMDGRDQPEMDQRDLTWVLNPIGRVESPLIDPAQAPKQGDEGAPDSWLVFDDRVREGLRDLAVGDELLVFTWLHRARRDVLVVHPRDNPSNPLRGVFATRSADRPNPIGMHRVQILAIQDIRIHVRNLEAIDGTPVPDVKPLLKEGEIRAQRRS